MPKSSIERADSEPNPKSEPWLKRSLSRARAHLSHAFSGAAPATPAQVEPVELTPSEGEVVDETKTIETARGRARMLLDEDRELRSPQPSAARNGTTPPPLPQRNGAVRVVEDTKLAEIKAKHANTKARLAAAKAQLAAAKSRAQPQAPVAEAAAEPAIAEEAPQLIAASPASDGEPIRTRTMARLLAQQGYPDRALSIYDELLADDATDPMLHAEAEELRTRQSDRTLN